MQMSTWAAVLIAPTLAAVAAMMPALPIPSWPAEAPAVVAKQADAAPLMPRYDGTRALLLPERYREWVFVGSSLGLSYNATATGMGMFHETLMEPTAYRHFVETGEFREGTMFVLMLHGVETGVLPGRRGQFAGAVHGVEIAVKDTARTPEGWAHYDFGGMDGVDKASQPSGPGCFKCHKANAARDNVFLQFYPLLAEAANVKVEARRGSAAPDAHQP